MWTNNKKKTFAGTYLRDDGTICWLKHKASQAINQLFFTPRISFRRTFSVVWQRFLFNLFMAWHCVYDPDPMHNIQSIYMLIVVYSTYTGIVYKFR
jgi:hypothetical protein